MRLSFDDLDDLYTEILIADAADPLSTGGTTLMWAGVLVASGWTMIEYAREVDRRWDPSVRLVLRRRSLN